MGTTNSQGYFSLPAVVVVPVEATDLHGGSRTTAYQYDAAGNLDLMVYPNGVGRTSRTLEHWGQAYIMHFI